jgi:hypothetical protein
MTPGRVVRAVLPTVVALPLDGSGLGGNPATAIALANQPTITPNYRSCPAPNSQTLLVSPTSATARSIVSLIEGFLNAGGTLVNLEQALREEWDALGEFGFVRGDLDLSGEGVPEAIISLETPDEGGKLFILGCVDGRYLTLYQSGESGSAPRLIAANDLNFNQRIDLVYSSEACAPCVYQTQIVTWNPERGRFTNLLEGEVITGELPTIEDVDQDSVQELLVRMDDPGDSETGPLRTGFTVYDWDGFLYTQSITQLDAPRFRIQVIHQGDSAFQAGDFEEAASLYDLAINNTSLEPWHSGDETPVLQSYALYRLMLVYAFIEDERLAQTVQAIFQNFPEVTAAPVYAELAVTFWNAYQATNNLNSACVSVKDVIAVRPEALDLLNRYGSRSPTYTADDVCPF